MSKIKLLASVPVGMLLLLLLATSSAHADPPTAQDDSYAVSEGGEIERIAPGLLLNDNDPDGDTLILSTTPQSEPVYGTLTLNPDGGFKYVHDGSESTEDFFVYEVCDDGSPKECSTALVSITIAPVNDAPEAVDDPESVSQGGTLTKSAPGLLGNDSDIEGNTLSISPTDPVSGPDHGTVTLSADGAFTYTHDNSENFSDEFEYQVCDNGSPSMCDIGKVTITISNVNDPPAVMDDEYELDEGDSLVISAPGVLDNDTDPDEQSLSVNPSYPTSGPNHGELTIGSNGSIAYVHDGSETVEDMFTYRACDTGTPKLCSSGTVTLTIEPVNDPPTAVDDTATIEEGGTLSVEAPGLLKTDTDPEGDALTVSTDPVTEPQHGTLTLSADGAYVYEHDGSETTSDSFTYEVCDDGEPVECSTAEVAITIEPVNDVVSIDLNGGAAGIDYEATFSTNAGAALIVSPNLRVIDPDDATLPAATIKLAAVPDGADEQLTAVTTDTNITTNYNSSTGALVLTGPDTVANFQKVLRTIRYSNQAADPDTSTRSVSFTVRDSGGTSKAATSTVTFQNPGIAISVTPNPLQINNGADAVFDVEVTNLGNVDLTDVTTEDLLVSNCDGRDLGTIAAGESKTFECKRSAVTTSFSHELIVTGTDPLGGTVSASETVIVNLVDANIAIAITPNQQTVGKGGDAILNVVVLNTSTVSALTDVRVETDNLAVCDRTVGDIEPGGSFGYTCVVEEVSDDFTTVATAIGTNAAEDAEVEASASAIVTVFELTVEISAEPESVGLTPEPVQFTLKISNNSSSIPVTLTEIRVSPFGNVANSGNAKIDSTNCDDSRTIAADSTYTCSFEATVGPPSTSFVAKATVEGSAEGIGNVTATDQLLIRIVSEILLPMVSSQLTDEPNDAPCDAYMLVPNIRYPFYANDINDWYQFGIADDSDVVVDLKNFASQNGQIAIWSGDSCDALSLETMTTISGPAAAVTLNDLEAGTYYVHILNAGAVNTTNPYWLEVQVD